MLKTKTRRKFSRKILSRKFIYLFIILFGITWWMANSDFFAFVKQRMYSAAVESIANGQYSKKLIKDVPADQPGLILKEERELKLNGRFYEIVAVQHFGGKKVYRCIEDQREYVLHKIQKAISILKMPQRSQKAVFKLPSGSSSKVVFAGILFIYFFNYKTRPGLLTFFFRISCKTVKTISAVDPPPEVVIS